MSKRTRTGNPLVAVAYIRVSKDEQKLGPEAQRASVEAVGALWRAAQGVLGARAGPAWRCWSVVCGGVALAANTNPPWTGPGGWRLVVPVPGTLPGGKEMGT